MPMYRLYLFFFTILFLFSFIMAAPTGKIEGYVLDGQTGEALPGANVVVEGTGFGAASDLNGKFVITQVPVGSYNLSVTYMGYQDKVVAIEVKEGETTTQVMNLDFRSIEGEVITVTAQVEGQVQAINQQFSSNTIANVVSAARIKELPDVNAAESIGRLPGVSIERSGGEANKVSIRGLEPKYNTVTVNGVRLPSSGSADRSVDLSLISSNMIDGITLKKANTPDMDADALGGTVDLKLKEATPGFKFNAMAQGGYNELQDYYGNYSFSGSINNRFYDNKLGVIANFNLDRFNRSADKFQGSYSQVGTGEDIEAQPSDISLRLEEVLRSRSGASLLLDYKIPSGKLTINSFYNRLKNDAVNRINLMNVAANRHPYTLEDREGTTSIFTGALGSEQDFGWIKYDVSVARTSSMYDSPKNFEWDFIQENGAFRTGDVVAGMDPHDIPPLQTIDTAMTGFQSTYIWDYKLSDNETSMQLNLQVPFKIGRSIDGYVKFGGKLRWLDRKNDENQWGQTNLQYGGTAYQNPTIVATLKQLDAQYPNDWNWPKDSTLAREYLAFPVSRFFSGEKSPRFLKGEYDLGFMIDERILRQFTSAMKNTAEQYPDYWLSFPAGSEGNDYDGIERFQAAYIMSEMSWKYFTFIPGVRYEQDNSKYNGQRFRGTGVAGGELPVDYEKLQNTRNNEFWLPMFHINANPLPWLKVRLARTETLTRPDFIQYAPITSIDIYGNYIRANNAELKPAKSANYDASIQVYENYTGFFTVSGFYKKIEDLIFQVGYQLRTGVPTLEGTNVPNAWRTNSPFMDTYVNNPNPAYYRGFELEWQTHFWYLPSFLQGLLLNVNYTRIFSEIDKQIYDTKQVVTGIPPRTRYVVTDTIRTARMPYQPAHILNMTLGYDLKGFSARLSFLYQSDKTTYIARASGLDQSTGTYYRWDLTLKQKLYKGFEIYSNLSNLNKRVDRSYIGDNENQASYTEYYGFTMDLGLRYNF